MVFRYIIYISPAHQLFKCFYTLTEGIKLIIGLDQERNVSIQYAKFFLRGPETAEPQLISVLYEAGTVQLLEEAGYKPIDIMIEMSEDKIKDISIAFNITRNNKNSLYILMSKSGDGEELMEGRLSQVMFTGLGEKTSELDILSEDQLKDIIQSGDLQYIRILPTFTNNESKQKEILNLLEQVKKLKKKWWKFW